MRTPRRLTHLGSTLVIATTFGCASVGPLPGLPTRRDAGTVLEKAREDRAAQHAAEDAAREEMRSEPASASELLKEGDRYREDERYADAFFTYLRAAKNQPDALAPKLRIGFLHLRDEPNRAARIFEALIEETPTSSQAHVGLGHAHFLLEDVDASRRAFARAVELEPDSSAARNAFGVVLDRSGEFEEARAQYRAAHQLDPENPRILGNLGASFLLAGDFELAADAFSQAVDRAPRNKSLRNNLGLALGRQGLIEEAFAAFLVVAPKAEAHNNLGFVHLLNRDYEAAMTEFEQAIGVDADQLPVVLKNWELARTGPERDRQRAEAEAEQARLQAEAEWKSNPVEDQGEWDEKLAKAKIPAEPAALDAVTVAETAAVVTANATEENSEVAATDGAEVTPTAGGAAISEPEASVAEVA